jgi:Cu/Zn superoxide dismutase
MDATETMAPLRMEWNMVGLEVSATGGIHIHSGTSCTDAASQGGHYYNTDMYTSSDEPWLVTKYTTDASGSSSGELTVLAGVAMSTIAPDTTTVGSNKVVVVHNAAGTRVACGILKSAGQKGTIKASADPNNPNGPRCSINSNPGACLAAGTLGNTGYLDGPSGSSTSFISGHMSDPYISLNGMNSIIGRSVVVRDTTGYSIGSCVVGRGYEKVLTQTAADYVIDALPATGATCVLQSTGVDTPSLAIANMGVYPGLSSLQPSPTGSVSLTDTIHMATATFTRYTGYAGTNLITAAGSKVTVSQISKKTLRLTYFLKSGTTIPNGRYGIHVHVGTDCGAEAGAHMWAPATDPDPWTADFAKYEITNGGVSGIAKGYFDIDIGYSLMATEGRVIVVHGSGGDKIACAKLSQESALAMEYNMENMGSNAKGGIHIHSGKTCEGATPAGHYYDTAVYTDVDLEPWKATFWTSDFGGRASGTIVINSGISVYENVDRVIVLHDGAGVKIACGKIRWARDASKTALRGNGGTDNGETGGNMDEVYGTITFENSHLTNGKTKINYNIIGLDHQSPYHSWHVHEFGDLSGGNDNGYFAGGHFVGSGDAKFIKDTYEVAYIGNSGSAGSYITTDSKGRSSGSIIDDDIQLTGLNSIIGRSIVVHGVRMNGRGAWWSTRAASCVVGRSIPESKTNSREFEDDSGIYLAYLQPYPGYNGDLIGVSGVVTVGQLDTETTVMNYELFGLESTGSQGGIHIHTGTTCATAAGHYWNEKTLVTDPWTPIKYNPTTSVRTSSGAVNVITGLSLSQNKGRTVVLHDSNGVRIACGVLGTKANSVSQLAQDAAAGGSGGACNAGSYFGVVRSIPTEVETTTNEYVSGIVSLSSSGSGTDGLELYYNLSSLVVSMPTDGTEEKRLVVGEIGKIEIHEGTTCEKTGEPFINKGTLPTLTTTPSASSGSESVGVTAANSTVSSYVKVASKMIDGAEYALTSGTVKINNGYGFSLNAGKTVVIYSKKGLKIGCAILASKGNDAALSELSTLALQGAAAYYNKANLIDTPGEILIFALSLGGCMILSVSLF